MPVLTMTYRPGALGEEIGYRLAKKLGLPLIRKKEALEMFLSDVATEYELRKLDESPKQFYRIGKNGKTLRDTLIQRVNEYADTNNAIMLGFTSGLMLINHPHAIHLNIVAPQSLREERLLAQKGATPQSVKAVLQAADRMTRRNASGLYGAETHDPFLYHLTINMAKVSVDAAVEMAAGLYRDHMAREFLFNSTAEDDRVRAREEISTEMKNESEVAFAKVLDMYHLRWIYEPKTFPLEWDEEGRVTMAFSPDFYLPDYDLYLELTIMNTKYASAKHKKKRLLEELYPGTKIEVVYKRDFDHLLRSLDTKGERVVEGDKEAKASLDPQEQFSEPSGREEEEE